MNEPSYPAAVRESYDTVAVDHAQQVKRPAELDPLSRAKPGAFADLVQEADRGPVADLGCGPGLVTAHLAGLGVPAFGVDLSPKMIEVARQLNPRLTSGRNGCGRRGSRTAPVRPGLSASWSPASGRILTI
ncbi:hypothetical protein GCM10010381_42430 [Streptomyces xantholiticus]|nr:hypothetical protein GCM10010381_42430 [Streptomyces xantholiticus]